MFGNNKKEDWITIILLLTGFAAFAANCVVCCVMDRHAPEVFPIRVWLKVAADTAWLAVAILGTLAVRTKRNYLLCAALVLFAAGDVGALYSTITGGVFYFAGHAFLLAAILVSGRVKKNQIAAFLILCVAGLAVLLAVFKSFTLETTAYFAYLIMIAAVFACSLSNTYFRVPVIVFVLSDFLGIIRKQLFNNDVFYVITFFVYCLAVVMLCMTAGVNKHKRNRDGS